MVCGQRICGADVRQARCRQVGRDFSGRRQRSGVHSFGGRCRCRRSCRRRRPAARARSDRSRRHQPRGFGSLRSLPNVRDTLHSCCSGPGLCGTVDEEIHLRATLRIPRATGRRTRHERARPARARMAEGSRSGREAMTQATRKRVRGRSAFRAIADTASRSARSSVAEPQRPQIVVVIDDVRERREAAVVIEAAARVRPQSLERRGAIAAVRCAVRLEVHRCRFLPACACSSPAP